MSCLFIWVTRLIFRHVWGLRSMSLASIFSMMCHFIVYSFLFHVLFHAEDLYVFLFKRPEEIPAKAVLNCIKFRHLIIESRFIEPAPCQHKQLHVNKFKKLFEIIFYVMAANLLVIILTLIVRQRG